MHNNQIGEEGAAAIAAAAAAGGLPRLKSAVPRHGSSPDRRRRNAGPRLRLRRRGLPRADGLNIGTTRLATPASLSSPRHSRRARCRRSRICTSYNNHIGDEGAKALMAAARGGWLARSSRLDVDGEQIGDVGRCGCWPALAEAIEDAATAVAGAAGGGPRQQGVHVLLRAACEARGSASRQRCRCE